MMGFVNLGLGKGGGYSVDGAGQTEVWCFAISPATTGILARQEFSLEVQNNVRPVGIGSV